MSDDSLLKQELQRRSLAFRRLGGHPGAWIIEEVVARIGIDCIPQPLPENYGRGVPRFCYWNTGRLVKAQRAKVPALRYVEGFAIRDDVQQAFNHAWAVDAENKVIDPTLAEPMRYQYRGVVISRADLMAATRGRSASVFLDSVGRCRVEYLCTLCPDIALLIEDARTRALGIAPRTVVTFGKNGDD